MPGANAPLAAVCLKKVCASLDRFMRTSDRSPASCYGEWTWEKVRKERKSSQNALLCTATKGRFCSTTRVEKFSDKACDQLAQLESHFNLTPRRRMETSKEGTHAGFEDKGIASRGSWPYY